MNNLLLLFLIPCLIGVAVTPFAFAVDPYTLVPLDATIPKFIDIELDVPNKVTTISWDYSELIDTEYCSLYIHVKEKVNFNFNLGLGFVGNLLDNSYSIGRGEAVNLSQHKIDNVTINHGIHNGTILTQDDAKVDCTSSMTIDFTSYDFPPSDTYIGNSVWIGMSIYNSTDNLIRFDTAESLFNTETQVKSDENTCEVLTASRDSHTEFIVYPNLEQYAYATTESCEDPTNNIVYAIESRFSEDNFYSLDYFLSFPTSVTYEIKSGSNTFNYPPTLGVNPNSKRMVEGGFSCNDNKVDVEYFHTEYPLITTEVGKTNTCELVIYENGGNNNIKWIQIGLGVEELGKFSESEVIAQLILSNTVLDKLNITDNQNLIQNLNVISIEPTKCKSSSNNESCLKIIFEYEYRESPLYNIIAVNLMDAQRSSWTFYFNDGIDVLGQSINEPPTDSFTTKKGNQYPVITFELVRTDKVNNIWTDQFGIEYHQINGRYDRITPLPEWKCNDTPLDQIMNGSGTRNNCHFRALTTIWSN